MLFLQLLRTADFAFTIDKERKMLQFKVRVMFLFNHLHDRFVSKLCDTSALLTDDLHVHCSADDHFV